MNNRSVTWIVVIVAGLLAVVALGLVMRGQTPPPDADQMVQSIPTADQTPGIPPMPEPPKPAPGRKSPDAPAAVPEGGYTTTPSGLKIHDFVVGSGASPQPGQIVKVDYTGWLKDGTKFDSSLDRATPIAFPAGTGKVIKGWDEAVLGMKVGGKRQVVIPPDLAYGAKGRPPVIPPDATLVFDMELVGVE